MLKNKVIALFAGNIFRTAGGYLADGQTTAATERLAESSKQRYLSFQLADEFRHTSMDLTRLARTYVSTGDNLYLEQYWDIVKWRNGERPRPQSVDRGLYPGETRKQGIL